MGSAGRILIIPKGKYDESETYELPPFVGKNVTGIARYYNSNLSQHSYTQWSDEEKEIR